ncbi:MAG: hypothetical protein ACI9CB_002589 [Rhodothermales bacterium]|jgi:hypothetical protein
MAAQSFTIFDGSTTGIGDGEGAWLRVKIKEGSQGDIDTTDELIHLVLTGSPLATIKILTANLLASPMISAPMQFFSGRNCNSASMTLDGCDKDTYLLPL